MVFGCVVNGCAVVGIVFAPNGNTEPETAHDVITVYFILRHNGYVQKRHTLGFLEAANSGVEVERVVLAVCKVFVYGCGAVEGGLCAVESNAQTGVDTPLRVAYCAGFYCVAVAKKEGVTHAEIETAATVAVAYGQVVTQGA